MGIAARFLNVDAIWRGGGSVRSTPQPFYHHERPAIPIVRTGDGVGPRPDLEGYVEEKLSCLTEVRSAACQAHSDSLSRQI